MDEKYIFECFCFLSNKLWFFTYDHNSLNCFDLESGETTTLGGVPWEKDDIYRLYGKMYYYDEKLFLIPYSAKKLVIFDLRTRDFFANDCTLEDTYYATYLKNNLLYMLPCEGYQVMCYDFQTGTLNRHEYLSSFLEKFKNQYYIVDSFEHEDSLIFQLTGSNLFVNYDLKTEEARLVEIRKSQKGGFYSLIDAGSGFFAASYEDLSGVYIKPDGEVIREFTFNYKKDTLPEKLFYTACVRDKKVYLSYLNLSVTFIIDFNTGKIDLLESVHGCKAGGYIFGYKNDLLFLPQYDRRCLLYLERNKIPFPAPCAPRFYKAMNEGEVLEESDKFSALDYISALDKLKVGGASAHEGLSD